MGEERASGWGWEGYTRLPCQLKELRARQGWMPLDLAVLSSEHLLLAQWPSQACSTPVAPSLLCPLLSA